MTAFWKPQKHMTVFFVFSVLYFGLLPIFAQIFADMDGIRHAGQPQKPNTRHEIKNQWEQCKGPEEGGSDKIIGRIVFLSSDLLHCAGSTSI